MNLVQIRFIEEKDYVSLCQLVVANFHRLQTYFPATTAAVVDAGSALLFIKKRRRQMAAKRQFYFVIVEAKSNTVIGVLNLRKINWTVPKGEISYFIDFSWQGNGFASDAVKELVDYSFNVLGFIKIYAQIDPANSASARVIVKNGFLKEGYLEKEFRTGEGELKDVVRYGLINKQR